MLLKIKTFLEDYKEDIWKGSKVFSGMFLLVTVFLYLPMVVRWVDERRYEEVCKAIITSKQEIRNRIDGGQGSYIQTTALKLEYDYWWDEEIVHGGDIVPRGAVKKKQFDELQKKLTGDTLFVLCTGAKNKIKMD